MSEKMEVIGSGQPSEQAANTILRPAAKPAEPVKRPVGRPSTKARKEENDE